MNYLRLIGYPTLLMLVVSQLIIKYFLFVPFQIDTTLNDLGVFLLTLATLCLAASGKIIFAINNIEAEETDHPKKPTIGRIISEKTGYNLFVVLNVIGIGIGFFLSNSVGHPGFSALFIIGSGLLYLYAIYLKKQLLIGNLVIAALAAMCILLLGLFDMLPAITPKNQATQKTIFSILLDYALLAFLLTWLREMLRNQKNINGDHQAGNNTLSIAIGKERTNKIIFAIAGLTLAGIIYYMYTYLFQNDFIILYALILIAAPLLYLLIKILSAKSQKDFSRLYSILTFVMWAALISIGLYKFILL